MTTETAIPPPPEARHLLAARRARHLSIRQAAERAGLSVTLWRQVEAGYTTPAAGVQLPKIAPAGTLAQMAQAVDLSPATLEEAGRSDAAEILANMLRQAEAATGTAASLGLRTQAVRNWHRTTEIGRAHV